MDFPIFPVVTTNAGAQAGHTSIHRGVKRVVFHLPTYPLVIQQERGRYSGLVYLNAGSVIDPESFLSELDHYTGNIAIHPLAAVITDECKEAENRAESAQTKIASTRKGVGEAISRKVLRSGMVAKDHPKLKEFVYEPNLNHSMKCGRGVLVEVPQGVSLGLNTGFYPYCTSRECTPAAAMADAGINPLFYGTTMLVLRTYPIRVGNIVEEGETKGVSGGFFDDQEETSWEGLGVAAEITTVTKRIRRVFSFSKKQAKVAMNLCRPSVIFLTFCNYATEYYLADVIHKIQDAADELLMPQPIIVRQWGPATDDRISYAA